MFNKSSLIISVALATLNTFGANPVQANEWEFQGGSLLITQSSIWQGGNNLISLYPYLGASYGHWQFNVETPVAYRGHLTENLSYLIALKTRDDGYDSDDFNLNSLDEHPIFEGYRAPDTEALASLGVQFGWLSFEVSRDIANKSDANSASLSVEVPVYENTQQLSIAMDISAQWYDDNYVNYYYGVAQEQVNTAVGRNAYSGDAATNYSLSIKGVYSISQSLILMAAIKHSILDENISASPLVENDGQSSFSGMVIYQF